MIYTVSIPDKGNLQDVCTTCPFLSKYNLLYWCNLTGDTIMLGNKLEPTKSVDCPVYHQEDSLFSSQIQGKGG